MTSRKLSLLSIAFAVSALVVAAPVSFDRGAPTSNAAFARGGDDGGCHFDDHGICSHGDEGEGAGHP